MADSNVCTTQPIPQGDGREVWRPVPGEPGVLASSMGRILLPPRHAPVHHGGYRLYTPKPSYGQVAKSRKAAKHEYMHVMVYTSEGGRQRPRKVHQLVCEAFHGPKPFDSAVVIHIDENGKNNRPENLKWGTQKENLNAMCYRMGNSDRNRRLTPAQSDAIRERYAAGEMQSALAIDYGVSHQTISVVVRRKRACDAPTWR